MRQQILQGLHDDVDTLTFQIEAETVGDGIQHLFARQAGIGQINIFQLRWQTFQQHAAQHGLAATNLAGDFDDAFAFCNGINKRIENFAPICSGKEKMRDRRDFERGTG